MSEEINEVPVAEESAAPSGGGKKKLILLVLVVLLLVGGGGGAYFFFLRGSSAEEGEEIAETKDTEKKSKKKSQPEEDEEEEEEEPKSSKTSSASKSSLKSAIPKDEEVKHIIELQPFIVNLADSDQARYLRLSVSVGIGGEEEAGEGEKADPIFITRVRNAMLAVLSVKSSEEVLTVEGKAKLRKELLKAAQTASEEPHVEAIYITDFIVQL